MKVKIRYKRLDSANWVDHPITPAQYFDPTDAVRPYEWDDVPEHLHTVDFLPLSAADISETELRIWEPDDHLRLTINEVFWNAGRNRIIARVEEDFELLIVQFRIERTPVIWHTIRLNRHADGRMLLEHLQIIETNQHQAPGPSQVLSLPAATGTVERNKPIELHYRLVDSTEWQTHPITPLEYYKPKEHGTVPNWEDVPKYEHAVEYLPFPPEQIVETEVRLGGDGKRWRREVSEVLWNHGRNRIVKCVDEGYTLLNIQVSIQENLLAHHTIGLLRNPDESGVLEHKVDIEGMGSEGHVLIVRRRL